VLLNTVEQPASMARECGQSLQVQGPVRARSR
jgi:hypothetical protein